MSTQPSLTGLPVELIEGLATLLSFTDLCNLRLTSNELAAKASQGRYKTCFQEKEVDLDDLEQLEIFKQLTCPGGLGLLVKRLTFLRYVGVEDGGDHIETKSPNHTLLLASLQNLKVHSTFRQLADLSLDVRARDDAVGRVSIHKNIWDRRTWDTPNVALSANVKGPAKSPHRQKWKATWILAKSLYLEMMAVLHESGLPVKRLSVFGDTENCSLGFDRMAAHPENALPSRSLAVTESLSLSLSHSANTYATIDDARSGVPATFAHNLHRLGRFLQLFPRLLKLDLHFFRIWSTSEQDDIPNQEHQFLDHLATSITFPNLMSCTLRGISCKSISLQLFLSNASQLRHVEVMKTNLSEGKWRPIFDILCARKLESLHLEDLYEAGCVYFLEVPGKPKLVAQGQRRGTDALKRSGPDAALPIKYEVASGRLLGSPAKNRYFAIDRWLYGPCP